MVYGYTRESTDGRGNESQRAEILEIVSSVGMTVDQWITEAARSNDRERLMHDLVNRLSTGDVVVVTGLSRIGRSMRDIYSVVERVTERGATIWTVNNGQRIGAGMDATGTMLVEVLAVAAGIERELISDRTRSGLRAARAAGKRLGRPQGISKLDGRADEIDRLRGLGVNKADVARIIGCSRSTLSLWLSKRAPAIPGSWKIATLIPAMPTAATMETDTPSSESVDRETSPVMMQT